MNVAGAGSVLQSLLVPLPLFPAQIRRIMACGLAVLYRSMWNALYTYLQLQEQISPGNSTAGAVTLHSNKQQVGWRSVMCQLGCVCCLTSPCCARLRPSTGCTTDGNAGWEFYKNVLTRYQALQGAPEVATGDLKIQTWIRETCTISGEC